MPRQKRIPATPTTFGHPEKRDWSRIILFWVFAVLAVAGIALMAVNNPREKNLVCSSPGRGSLIGFGNCSEE